MSFFKKERMDVKIHMQFFCVGIWFFCVSVRAEGFIADTLVHTSGKAPSTIKQVCDKIGGGQKQFVSSWHEKHDLWDSKRVRRAGRGTINCTVTLSFDSDQAHDIICSPLQRFYLADRHKWVAACALHPGDTLRTQSGDYVPLRDILLNKHEAVVYALRVKKNHTFCVGHYRVLTHNKRIPLLPLALMARIGVAFGTGAVAGGSTGSFFGPVTMASGFTIGGVVGAIATCAAIGCELYQYRMQIGTHQIESMVPSQRSICIYARQTMNAPTPGYADVNIPLPVEDRTMPGGCGDMQPPDITHSGGCGHPSIVFNDMPRGCGAIPPELANRGGIGCCPGTLVHSFAQENGQADAPTKTIEEILKDCSPGRVTKGPAKQFEKGGGFEQAEKDFESLGVNNITPIAKGKRGTLPDGRTINVRTDSTFELPTLEIYNPNTGRSIKIRYNQN